MLVGQAEDALCGSGVRQRALLQMPGRPLAAPSPCLERYARIVPGTLPLSLGPRPNRLERRQPPRN